MKQKGKRPVTTGNPDLAAAMRDKRSSHAAGPHDSRPHRLRSRRSSRDAAIREQRGE